MKWVWLGLGGLGFIAFFVFYVRSRGGEMVMTAQLDQTIVQPYIRAVASGDYESAYMMLAEGYRREVSLEKFRGAQEKRRAVKGTVIEARLYLDQVLRTLFSSKREVRIFYKLRYQSGEDTGWVILEEGEKNVFCIEGTYRENAGDSLDFVVW
jgi:hypothetical protein